MRCWNMHPLHLLVIACIFGALVVLAVTMILASPALIPATGNPAAGNVKYTLDAPLPGPHNYTGIDFASLS
jgi:RsiW-degrading membrane proteinase PrsW (M82 family)